MTGAGAGLSITIPKSIDHNFGLEQDLEVDNRRLWIIVSNSVFFHPKLSVGVGTLHNIGA